MVEDLSFSILTIWEKIGMRKHGRRQSRAMITSHLCVNGENTGETLHLSRKKQISWMWFLMSICRAFDQKVSQCLDFEGSVMIFGLGQRYGNISI
jgi:hypothetical protein